MRLESSVIPLGGTSGSHVSTEAYSSFTFYGPGAFTGVVTLQCSPDNAQTWFAIVDASGAPVTLGGSGIAIIPHLQATHVRAASSLAEAVARNIEIHGTGPEAF